MSEAFKVEKGIPIIPCSKKAGGRPPTWAAMEVGDSVFMDGKKAPFAYNQYGHLRKSKGMSFTTRTTEENGLKGIRVWRIQ